MKYDYEFLQSINESVDLLEYISRSNEMKQKNNDYFITCPLHTDLTPSLSVTPIKNRFYCFSCGIGGGIISWLNNVEKLPYDESVKKASLLAEIDLSTMCQSETVKVNRDIKKIMDSRKIDCVNERKILDKSIYNCYTIDRIDEWLSEGIRQEEIDLFEIRVDKRSNQIVYPVYDNNGNFINIKARTRIPNYKQIGLSKYTNYYPIGTLDYFQGINHTLPFIKESGEIKIFESIKSVMKLYGNDVKDSVAAEKHTLTHEQIVILIKLGCKVVFCYDSDVDYNERRVRKDIDTLKRFLDVYIIEDRNKLLGGKDSKCSPIDKGIDIWNSLYKNKTKII